VSDSYFYIRYYVPDFRSFDLDKNYSQSYSYYFGGRRGRERMIVGFITTNASSAYHH